ncbi:TVP38/TMEM64 family protein [bacterium]|jgi:uncharacterized membrane protein YdjX (TVP38/TMEM64 family)|nr:TVP38/TMEM64 family protein [bacterium]MBT4552821.1 TVP38/TMEM64 family protein [bacterium]MBT7087842.1 TVP38/TMEM64 family protein [bacterium]
MKIKEIMSKIFKKNNLKFLILILFLAHSTYLYFFYSPESIFELQALQTTLNDLGKYGPLGFILTFIISALLFFPNSLLAQGSGQVWGIIPGTFYTLIGMVFATFISFSISRYLGRRFIYFQIIRKHPDLHKLDILIRQHSFWVMLISRLIFGPYLDFISYLAGLSPVSKKRYFPATLLGILPTALIYNILGALSLNFSFVFFLLYLALSALILLSTYFTLKHFQK